MQRKCDTINVQQKMTYCTSQRLVLLEYALPYFQA